MMSNDLQAFGRERERERERKRQTGRERPREPERTHFAFFGIVVGSSVKFLMLHPKVTLVAENMIKQRIA